MGTVRIALLLLLAQLAPAPTQRTGTASIEGVIVRLGTNEPISGVDLELTDTTPAAPPIGATPTLATPALFTAKSGSDRKCDPDRTRGTYKLEGDKPAVELTLIPDNR